MSKFVIILLVAMFAACITADDNADPLSGIMTGFMKPIDDVAKEGQTVAKTFANGANQMVHGFMAMPEQLAKKAGSKDDGSKPAVDLGEVKPGKVTPALIERSAPIKRTFKYVVTC